MDLAYRKTNKSVSELIMRRKGIKHILIWGWYGLENLGDDLLLDTMLQHLQAEITVPMNKPYELQNVNEIPRSYKNLLMGAFHNDVLIIGPGGCFRSIIRLKCYSITL